MSSTAYLTSGGMWRALAAFTVVIAGCAQHSIEKPAVPITNDAVVNFLHSFEKLAEQENFALIRDMIAEDAYFRFNDGDFIGRPAIQAAFEKTWRGDPTVKKARFYLTDIKVLTIDDRTATATYTYNWEGSQGDRAFTIRGRGTRVLVRNEHVFRIVHEHLSRFPRPQ